MDNMKHNKIYIMAILEGEESEQWTENLFEEIMTANFLNLVKEKTHKSRKLRESQRRWTQRGLQRDTSKLK